MTESLQTLLAHAERERDETQAALLQTEEALRRQRLQWQQLQSYHADYAARAPKLGGRVAAIDSLRSHTLSCNGWTRRWRSSKAC